MDPQAAPETAGDLGAGSEPERAPATAGDVAVTFCATLVDEWVSSGLSHAVVAPGSRSTPMALALAEDPRVRVHVFHDERSAAFCALGIGVASGRPAIVLCTSGTAAAELHAAVLEAHHACVPLLALTADRPPELQGVGAPQTVDQRDLYGSAVRWYCEPGPPQWGGAGTWRDLARDAWGRTLGLTPGPVQLNLAFREPLVGRAVELPGGSNLSDAPAGPQAGEPGTGGASWGLTDEDLSRLSESISARRGVIVAGARAARDPDSAAAVLELAGALGWPVLADALSGCRLDRPGVITAFDPILRAEEFAETHSPEVVLRVGGLLASKAAGSWLARSRAIQFGLDRTGRVPDPERLLARAYTADVALVCRQLIGCDPRPAPARWREGWMAAELCARAAIDSVLAAHPEATEPAAALDLLSGLPAGSALVASSSMPERDLEWYGPAREDVTVLANRGANGIDGVTSTALGVALARKGEITGLLIGDVAFLHDSAALVGLARRNVSMVIVVVDNDGGGIFSFLPQRSHLQPDRFEQLFGTPHGVDLVALASAHGVPAERVSTRAGLQAAVAGAVTRGGVRLVVVEGDRDANVEIHRELNEAVARALGAAATVAGDG